MYDYQIENQCEISMRWTNRLGDYYNELYPHYADGEITEAPFGLEGQNSSVTGAAAAGSNHHSYEGGDFSRIYTNIDQMRPNMDK